MREPTVLLVVPSLEIGGAQATAVSLARHLPAAGWRVAVATFRDGPVRADLEAAGAPVEVLADRRHRAIALPWFLADMWRIRRELRDLLARHDARVVQIQTLGTLAFLVMTLRAGGRTKVCWRIANVSFPGDGVPGAGAAVKRALHRVLYRRGASAVDGVIAVSDEVASAFVTRTGAPRARVHVILNGVDTDRFPARVDRDEVRTELGFGPEDRLLTCVASFKEQKGHAVLVDAAAKLLPSRPDTHLLLVGDGALRAAITGRVDEAGIGGQVRFLGDRRDVDRLLAASDGFVLPSLWEGFSVALAEAMASGLPVVATAVSGTTQVMTDGVTGWLVPPGDVAALETALAALLDDPAQASARGRAARARVEAGFSARTQAERYAAVFDGSAVRPTAPTTAGSEAVATR